ncbi:MAG: patatin-like phospholipase family protein [Proteobacteria bacterium]|nr:patatin-like phospholipase family protein [Pseudomonadota bacterium]
MHGKITDIRSRLNKGKIAVVCAGGGITGGVYEIGCLRALDEILVNKSVVDFDMFIGISAGSMIASALSFGVTPDLMFKTLIGPTTEIQGFNRGNFFTINYPEFIRKLISAPSVVFNILKSYWRNRKDMHLFDALTYLQELIPSGLIDGGSIAKDIQASLANNGREDSFRSLAKELYVIAVNLDTGQRAVFGESNFREVPISKAVQASCSLPLLFRPTRINGADYIDGGVFKTVHLDVAARHGADLIICINPIVPLYNNPATPIIPLVTGKSRYLRDRGMIPVVDQAFRILIHSRLRYGIEQFRLEHPDIDLILLEPDPTDYMMFFYNILRFSSRVMIAEHGFEQTRKKINENFDSYAQVFARHGYDISHKFIDEEAEETQRHGNSLTAIAKKFTQLPLVRRIRG